MKEHMRTALRIYNFIIQNGSLSSGDDSALYIEYSDSDVSDFLELLEEENQCKFFKINNTIYLLPNIGNSTIGFDVNELKRSISSNMTLKDYYTMSYIVMYLLYQFYSGKNHNPKCREFIPLNYLIDGVTARLEQSSQVSNLSDIEEEKEINIGIVHTKWTSMTYGELDETKIGTRVGFTRKIITSLEKKNLVTLDSENIIRTTKRLDDLMLYHYLKLDRSRDLEELFLSNT